MIQSVAKVLRIMEYVAQNGNCVRLQDIVDVLGMEKTTAHNFLKTLVELGYMEKDDASPRYRLTNKTQFLVPPTTSVYQLKQKFRPVLEQITQQIGETSYLTVQMGNYIRHELKCDPNRSVRISLELGKEVDILHSAIGNVFMAHSTHLKQILLDGMTLEEIAFWEERIDGVISRGYAIDFERLEKELNCMALPIFEGNRLVAALGVSGPSYRFQAPQMKEAAQFITSLLDEI